MQNSWSGCFSGQTWIEAWSSGSATFLSAVEKWILNGNCGFILNLLISDKPVMGCAMFSIVHQKFIYRPESILKKFIVGSLKRLPKVLFFVLFCVQSSPHWLIAGKRNLFFNADLFSDILKLKITCVLVICIHWLVKRRVLLAVKMSCKLNVNSLWAVDEWIH